MNGLLACENMHIFPFRHLCPARKTVSIKLQCSKTYVRKNMVIFSLWKLARLDIEVTGVCYVEVVQSEVHYAKYGYVTCLRHE